RTNHERARWEALVYRTGREWSDRQDRQSHHYLALPLHQGFTVSLAGVLTTVYTRAGGELTDPQEGCKLEDIKHKNISRRTAMLRSQTVNTIHDVHAQGKSVQAIAQESSISR